MSTRALIAVMEDGCEICTIYRHCDGYPSGLGADLKKLFGETRIGNGISGSDEMGVFANGMGCLAAQIVARMKERAGGIYIRRAGARNCGEEYIYELYKLADKVAVRVCGDRELYDGPLSAFDPNS